MKKQVEDLSLKNTLVPNTTGMGFAIDEDLDSQIFNHAYRSYSGFMYDIEIDFASSQDLRAIIRTGLTTSELTTEADGTFTPIERGESFIKYGEVIGRMSTESFDVFISDEVDNDTNITNDVKTQSSIGISESFGKSILSGTGTMTPSAKDNNFRGVISSRLDTTPTTGEARQDDATRHPEYFGATFAGIDISTITTDDEKLALVEKIDDFLASLPSIYDNTAKVYMPKNVFLFLRKLRLAGKSVRLIPELAINKLGKYDVVFDDGIVTDLTGSDALMIFGDANAALSLKSLPSITKENPYSVDGATVYTNKMRLIENIKSNNALRIFVNGT